MNNASAHLDGLEMSVQTDVNLVPLVRIVHMNVDAPTMLIVIVAQV